MYSPYLRHAIPDSFLEMTNYKLLLGSVILSSVLVMSYVTLYYFWHSCSPVTSVFMFIEIEPIHAPSVSRFRLLPGLTQFQ